MKTIYCAPGSYAYETAAASRYGNGDDEDPPPLTATGGAEDDDNLQSTLKAVLPAEILELLTMVVILGITPAEIARRQRKHRGNALRKFQRAKDEARLRLLAFAGHTLLRRGAAGFTLDPRTGDEVERRDKFAVSDHGCERRFDHAPTLAEMTDYCLRRRDVLLDENGNAHFGCGLDAETGDWCLDVTRLYDRAAAAAAGKRNRQRWIRDLLVGVDVPLPDAERRTA